MLFSFQYSLVERHWGQWPAKLAFNTIQYDIFPGLVWFQAAFLQEYPAMPEQNTVERKQVGQAVILPVQVHDSQTMWILRNWLRPPAFLMHPVHQADSVFSSFFFPNSVL